MIYTAKVHAKLLALRPVHGTERRTRSRITHTTPRAIVRILRAIGYGLLVCMVWGSLAALIFIYFKEAGV